jgi:excisionase family DNA binding protein
MPAQQLLTADEVADLLRVGRSTVYEWARRGDLPCVVLRQGNGRAVRRWEARALDEFIRRGRTSAEGT